MQKKVSNLGELVDLVGKDTADKCFTEYIMMLMVAKANRLEKVESLIDRISEVYDKTDATEEIDLKAMFLTLTEILCEYENLERQVVVNSEKIIFTSKEELDKYNTKLLLGFVDYLNKLHKKNHQVFNCGVSIQIVDEVNLVEDFISKVELK